MKKHWWKALGAILIFYALILGLSAPIKPALIEDGNNAMRKAKAGEPFTTQIVGYNTNFKSITDYEALLSIVDGTRKADGTPNVFSIKAISAQPISETRLELKFQIPPYLPLSKKLLDADIAINAGEEGLLLRKTAVQLAQDSINAAVGQQLWTANFKSDIVKNKRFSYPNLAFTRETIRNTFFHVPMWFTMFTLFAVGMWYSVRFLRGQNMNDDMKAVSYTQVGTLFGVLGLLTGGTWANFAWGEPFPIQEIKLLMTYTALAIYFAYFILRGSFDDFEKRARISAVYSIFAFASLVPLLYVIPKIANASLHPGNGDNSSIAAQDMENTMRAVFYPSSLGWILIGLWIAQLVVRSNFLKEKFMLRQTA
jgi:heme exporter protein C